MGREEHTGGPRQTPRETEHTGDLQQALMETEHIESYIKQHAGDLRCGDTAAAIQALLKAHHITNKAELARRAVMSEVYLHQVLAGRRKPSRDRLLCLCIGLEASLEEIQSLLKQARYAQLYPRDERDAVIAHGILHGIPLSQINDKLFDLNQKTLY